MRKELDNTKLKSASFLVTLIVLPISIIGALMLLYGGNTPGNINYEIIEEEALQERFSDFEVTTEDGKDTRLKKYKGKLLLVNSWAMWNPFSVDELVAFSMLQQEFSEKIEVVAVNRSESQEDQEEYIEGIENRLELKLDNIIFLTDFDDELYHELGGVSMPETLVFDQYGNLVFHQIGPMEYEVMNEIIQPYL